jgi:phosphoesterase RecJ-like protein
MRNNIWFVVACILVFFVGYNINDMAISFPRYKVAVIDITEVMSKSSELQELKRAQDKDMEELNNQDGDQENIVNYGRNIEGVEVSVFLREKDGKYKASLRSNTYVDVSNIATMFSGGGHTKAAGFEISATLEDAKEMIISEIKKQLK